MQPVGQLLKYWMNQPLGALVRDILKGPFKHLNMTVFPTLFYTSTREIPIPGLLYTSRLKKLPLSGRASPYSTLGVPPSPLPPLPRATKISVLVKYRREKYPFGQTHY